MRICLLIIIFIMQFLYSSFALGVKDTGTITAVVNIKGLFQLSMSREIIDFPDASPGKTADSDYSVTVVSRSSGGERWYVQVSNDKPLTSGNNMISNKNLTWGGTTSGSGKWYGNDYKPFETYPNVAYRSSEDEGNNTPQGTRNDFKFRLFVPENQAPGEYTCSVMFTMTE